MNDMSDRKVKTWFTVNGKHIPIFEGETKQDVVDRLKKGARKGRDSQPKKILSHSQHLDKAKDLKNLKKEGKYEEAYDLEQELLHSAHTDKIPRKSALSKKEEDIQRNKDEADKLNAEKKARSKMTATTKTQSEHKKAIAELNTNKYEDGTYDIATKKPVEFPRGFQVTFCQIGDNYSDEDFAKKVNECLKNSSDGKTYAGKFESTPEISFHWNDREKAIAYARANNQISIWDWETMDVIPTGGTGERKKK